MTDNIDDIIASVNINSVLAAILQEHGKLSVPVMDFLDAHNINRQLIIDYDEEGPSFIFSLGEVIGE